MSKLLPWVLAVVVTLAVGGALLVALRSGEPPDGPVAAVWDHEVCVFCRMHLGEPAFAAQLQTTGGEVFFFDDPGCLFEYLDSERPSVHAIYFRDHGGERWLGRDEVAFVSMTPTPMGYEIAAVPKGTTESFTIEQAHARVRARRERR